MPPLSSHLQPHATHAPPSAIAKMPRSPQTLSVRLPLRVALLFLLSHQPLRPRQLPPPLYSPWPQPAPPPVATTSVTAPSRDPCPCPRSAWPSQKVPRPTLSACSVGWFVSWLVREEVLLAGLCERKIMFQLEIYDRLRQATAKRTCCQFVDRARAIGVIITH